MMDNGRSPERFLRSAARIGLLSSLLIWIGIMSWNLPQEAAAQSYRTPTRTAYRYVTRTPTLTPTAYTASFSSVYARKVNPGDVLDEIYIGGWGAGPWDCSEVIKSQPWMEYSEGYAHLMMEWIEFGTCGWRKGEYVKVVVEFPNGRQISQTIRAEMESPEKSAHVGYTFTSTENDPIGVYRVIFSGMSGRIEERFRISRPVGPYMFLYTTRSSTISTDFVLRVYQFAANEKFRLFSYDSVGRLRGWEAYQADRRGNLLVNISIKNYYPGMMAIIGEKSGEGDLYLYSSSDSNLPMTKNISQTITRGKCPNAPVQRMQIGSYGEVCTKSDSVIVRRAARRSSAEVTRLMPGTSFLVTGPAACADNWSFWPIRLDDGRTGWISEGGDSIDPYFICPMY